MGAIRRPRARVGVGVAIAAILASLGLSALTPGHAARQVTPAAARLASQLSPAVTQTSATTRFGLYKDPNDLQYQFPKVPEQPVKYLGWSSSGTEAFPTAQANAVYQSSNGVAVPFIELQSCTWPYCTKNDMGYSLVDIAKGAYDSSLRTFNAAVLSYGHKVVLTFDHEMNGDWYPWGYQHYAATQWIAAWKHVVSIINAPNATWLFASNINTSAVHPLSAYWPGRSNVGRCGIDGYLMASSATWANTIAASVASLKSICGTKPWELAETGVTTANANAVAQIDDLMTNAISSGATKVVYFDKYGYTFSEGSGGTLNEFLKYVH